jgi:hypothetical protein
MIIAHFSTRAASSEKRNFGKRSMRFAKRCERGSESWNVKDQFGERWDDERALERQ